MDERKHRIRMSKVMTGHLVPDLGLGDEARFQLIGVLNRVVADEYLLYTKTRNYHWNVTGPRFHDLHLLFEKQYEQLDLMIDEVAEYVRGLGGPALGSMGEFLEHSRLVEEGEEMPNADTMVNRLLVDHEATIRNLRRDIEAANQAGEAGAADLLTGFLESHQKMAWMLRSTVDR